MSVGRVLVTGASGFIGSRILHALRQQGVEAGGLYRTRACATRAGDCVGDVRDPVSLQAACAGVTTLIHCAGHAHAFGDTPDEAARRHHEINLVGTQNLLAAAVQQGVRRFVFLSSVKAMAHPGGSVADEHWPGLPDSPYGRAKRAAEQAVHEAGEAGLQVTTLRLAMTYGAGGHGNLERMARGIRRGWFPPLPHTAAKRSVVHVNDVVAAVETVLNSPQSIHQTYIVAHPEAVSGAELYDAIRQQLGRAPARWRVPAGVLWMCAALGDGAARVLRRPMPISSDVVERLLGSECYTSAALSRDTGWQARMSLPQGLADLLSVSEPQGAKGMA